VRSAARLCWRFKYGNDRFIRAAQGTGSPQSERSPFARLAELLARTSRVSR